MGVRLAIPILVVVMFLLHDRASIIIAVSLPLAVPIASIAMRVFGVDANIIWLVGIAIAIGTMVDMGIIILENIYDHLAEWESQAENASLEGGMGRNDPANSRGPKRFGQDWPGRFCSRSRSRHDGRDLCDAQTP